ncbi:MAG: hypothetical protein A2934_02985 [Candidatus Sungbacteria bacterium RIFCSPLOWO2_01_FULL_47_10]|uniref:Uncharacterized protein n=1 Tax=Candidatus Sungbacteria bacterium RIFCSPLOWO2_01_FULL_47_10 TaxID=1802276 RepID=A0A1G2LAE3_9BACT|nr:MAG: hypothetical protein A2934_02985 [Candidatus Sungbacteria bacterium RIFCSPLOWO2_01_FULL_47_10]
MKRTLLVLLLLTGCATQPIKLTGLSKDPSPYLLNVNILIRDDKAMNLAKGSLVIYPTNIQNGQIFRCATAHDNHEYLFSINRKGPADKANSFFFSVWKRMIADHLKTYTLWKGYVPEPKNHYAFTELITYDEKQELMVSITTHVSYDEKGQKMLLEDLNSAVRKSTLTFRCYTEETQ